MQLIYFLHFLYIELMNNQVKTDNKNNEEVNSYELGLYWNKFNSKITGEF